MGPIEVMTIDGIKLWSADSLWVDKMVLFGNKLAHLSHLVTANRPLCRHEIVLCTKMAIDLGFYFTASFPLESITYKAHLFYHHFHHFNELNASVGKSTVGLVCGIVLSIQITTTNTPTGHVL